MDSDDEFETPRARPSRWFRVLVLMLVVGFAFLGYELGVIMPPQPTSESVNIEQGMNAEDIARMLKSAHVIRSELLFVWGVYIGGVHDRLSAGHFVFTQPLSMIDVVFRLRGTQKEITIVIPEGLTTQEIGDILEKNSIGKASDFIQVSHGDFSSVLPYSRGYSLEGFLFPDTYRFYELVTDEEVITKLLENFVKKIRPFEEEISGSGHSLYEILTVASMLEREAKTDDDRAVIAGILWKRLREGALLQVDATLGYITGKGSLELTLDDLKIDNPYNTYKYKGLPPSPIANPGIASIQAALRPIDSPYYFYLSDSEGKIHFARTFEEHRRNKLKYIK